MFPAGSPWNKSLRSSTCRWGVAFQAADEVAGPTPNQGSVTTLVYLRCFRPARVGRAYIIISAGVSSSNLSVRGQRRLDLGQERGSARRRAVCSRTGGMSG